MGPRKTKAITNSAGLSRCDPKSCCSLSVSLMIMEYELAMRHALSLLKKESGEVPVAALVLDPTGSIVAEATNNRNESEYPLGHAEILALTLAAERKGSWRLEGHSIVTTLEPCSLCASLIGQCRVSKLIFGAYSPISGSAGSVYDIVRDPRLGFHVEVTGGILQEECSSFLKHSFSSKRMLQKKRG